MANCYTHMLNHYYDPAYTQQLLHSSWMSGKKYILPGDAWNNICEDTVPPVQSGFSEDDNKGGIARISPSELDPEPGADLRWRV